jgi:hypothetical protein
MSKPLTLRVEFLSADGAQAPLTWGQYSIWRPIQALPQSSSSFNFKRVLPLAPRAVTVDFAAAALRQLIERHQTLRAHFFAGRPAQQRVEMSGAYEVEIVDVASVNAAAEAAQGVALRLASSAFDLDTEWPARFAFIRVDGMVQSICLATSHVGTDFFAIERLLADFRELLAGVTPPKPAWGPLAQAELESSPAGLRRSRRSLEHWRKYLSVAPERMFSGEPGPGEPLPFQTWALTSPAIAWAVPILAERTRTSSSAVLLTASALLLRVVTRRQKAILKIIVGNRFSPQDEALMAPTCNDGIFVCAPESGDVAAAIARAHRDAIETYMNASYDPDALIELTQQVARERGAPIDLSAYFNDARLGKEWPAVPNERISRDELNRLRAQSQIALLDSLPEHDMSYCVTVVPYNGPEPAAVIRLLADTHWLSADVCQRCLLGFEELLCEAALRSVALDEVPSFFPPAR